jgi:hypothetical protein
MATPAAMQERARCLRRGALGKHVVYFLTSPVLREDLILHCCTDQYCFELIPAHGFSMTRHFSPAVTVLQASRATDVRRTWMIVTTTSVKIMPPVSTWCRHMNAAVLQDSWVNSLSVTVHLHFCQVGMTYNKPFQFSVFPRTFLLCVCPFFTSELTGNRFILVFICVLENLLVKNNRQTKLYLKKFLSKTLTEHYTKNCHLPLRK